MNGDLFDFDEITDYVKERDQVRYNKQLASVWQYMLDGKWHTQEEIAQATNIMVTGASAHMRSLRKEKFGGHTVERKRMDNGIYTYRLIPNEDTEVIIPDMSGKCA